MKQIIGYMEYDIRIMKQGLGFFLLIYGIVSIIFASDNGMMTIAYMLFGGIIIAASPFGWVKENQVAFWKLVPGTSLQKVLGRFLGMFFSLLCCALIGVIICTVVKSLGYRSAGIDMQMLAVLTGMALVMIALQSVLLYLLVPVMGVQLTSLIRMVPGMAMFFIMMEIVQNMSASELEKVLTGATERIGNFGGFFIAAGVISQMAAIFLCWLIERRRNGI